MMMMEGGDDDYGLRMMTIINLLKEMVNIMSQKLFKEILQRGF